MQLTLPPDLEQALREEAEKIGTTPEQLALNSLRERFENTPANNPLPQPATLADFLGEAIGTLNSSEYFPEESRLSEGSGKKFAIELLKGKQQS